MKSITTKPPMSLSLSCRISTAASRFVLRAVFQYHSLVDFANLHQCLQAPL